MLKKVIKEIQDPTANVNVDVNVNVMPAITLKDTLKDSTDDVSADSQADSNTHSNPHSNPSPPPCGGSSSSIPLPINEASKGPSNPKTPSKIGQSPGEVTFFKVSV